MPREFHAEAIRRQLQRRFSRRFQVDAHEDIAYGDIVVRVASTEFARVVWTQEEDECYLTLRDAFRAAMPRWTWRFIGRPTTHRRVLKLYHSCPHIDVAEQSAHLNWLAQDAQQ